jgi:hypothetical protein
MNIVNFMNVLRDLSDAPLIFPLLLCSLEKLIERKGIDDQEGSAGSFDRSLETFTMFTKFIFGLSNQACLVMILG